MQDQQEGVVRIASGALLRRGSFALLDSGMRPVAACLEVGVHERAGRDWAKGVVKSTNRRHTFDCVLIREASG